MPAMADAGLLRKVRYLDWRPHGNFHQMERIPERYCAIERQLSATHACAHRDGSPETLVHWERWANLDRACWTLFQVWTEESWSEAIARPLLFSPDWRRGLLISRKVLVVYNRSTITWKLQVKVALITSY